MGGERCRQRKVKQMGKYKNRKKRGKSMVTMNRKRNG